MLRTACPLVFVCALAAAASAAAQERDVAAQSIVASTPVLVAPLRPTLVASVQTTFAASASQPTLVASVFPGPSPVEGSGPSLVEGMPKNHRPAALVPLYASFATLQALDYASTTRALSRGTGTEANPMMRSIVENRAAFMAVKAGAAAGLIIASEKMWKKNRLAAVIFVAAANGAVAAIVARNYSVR